MITTSVVTVISRLL